MQNYTTMSKMQKFTRKNKLTQVDEKFVGVQGTIESFNTTPRENENGKSYHRFTAKVTTPNGDSLIGGQVYTGLLVHIGGMPEVGAKMGFACLINDLKEGHNGYWNISGNAIDAVSDEFLNAIDEL